MAMCHQEMELILNSIIFLNPWSSQLIQTVLIWHNIVQDRHKFWEISVVDKELATQY